MGNHADRTRCSHWLLLLFCILLFGLFLFAFLWIGGLLWLHAPFIGKTWMICTCAWIASGLLLEWVDWGRTAERALTCLFWIAGPAMLISMFCYPSLEAKFGAVALAVGALALRSLDRKERW